MIHLGLDAKTYTFYSCSSDDLVTDEYNLIAHNIIKDRLKSHSFQDWEVKAPEAIKNPDYEANGIFPLLLLVFLSCLEPPLFQERFLISGGWS